MAANPKAITLDIDGMTCASCVRRVERALCRVEGVETASVNFASETARVTLRPAAGRGNAGRRGAEGRLRGGRIRGIHVTRPGARRPRTAHTGAAHRRLRLRRAHHRPRDGDGHRGHAHQRRPAAPRLGRPARWRRRPGGPGLAVLPRGSGQPAAPQPEHGRAGRPGHQCGFCLQRWVVVVATPTSTCSSTSARLCSCSSRWVSTSRKHRRGRPRAPSVHSSVLSARSATVLRDGLEVEVAADAVQPGDLVFVSARASGCRSMASSARANQPSTSRC